MQLYAILRRDGFADGLDLQAAAARSTTVVVRPDPAVA